MTTLLLLAEILLLGLTVLAVYHWGGAYRLVYLAILLGGFQHMQSVLAAFVQVDLFGRFVASPGSIVFFSSSLYVVLLVYIREGVPTTRAIIYGLLLSDVILSLLRGFTQLQLSYGGNLAPAEVPAALISLDFRWLAFGTLVLLLDSLLIIILYEFLFFRARRLPLALRIVGALVAVLWFDATVFSIGVAGGSGRLEPMLTGHLVGKAMAGIAYGLLLWAYLRWTRYSDPARDDVISVSKRDIFSIITYREHYERVKAEKESLEAAHERERAASAAALEQSHEQLRQMQKMEAIGRLAGGIAHDFNNILTGVGGYADLILGSLPPHSPLRHDMAQIGRAAARGSQLTQQLLAFSRKQALQPVPLDLNEAINALRRFLGGLLDARVILRSDLAPDLAPVLVDPGQLDQALTNLVLNARDAMPQGGVITICTRNVNVDAAEAARLGFPGPQPMVQLLVGDTGIGMDAATLKQIFEPFFTTKARGQGTGLGLATVYGIVRQSGGAIDVTSVPGEGSSFIILLPRSAAAPGSVQRPPAPALAAGHETLLLVEDDSVVRDLSARILRDRGYQVSEAENMRAAEAIAEDLGLRLELLVSDLGLPDGTGRELARRLVQRLPGLRVLFITGHTDLGSLEGDRLLRKPFTLESLARSVREALDAPPSGRHGS